MRSTALVALAAALAASAITASSALAITAPIHVTGDVNLRAAPTTSAARVGGIYRGTSPDFNCWTTGDVVNKVDVWFSVNSGGATGYYASGLDDSSYAADADITSKYGIPACGQTPQTGSPAPVPTPPAAPTAVYFSPYKSESHELTDHSVRTSYSQQWWSRSCAPNAAAAARSAAGGKTITTLAGWSLGRVGVIRYLASASDAELRQLGYVLMIDPGAYDELTCDRQLSAGSVLAHWLTVNPSAHLAVVSSSEVSQQGNSRGIQESYFNDIRNQSVPPRINLRPRVLTCNYSFSHQQAFASIQYWIQHQIGTSDCPHLGSYVPTAAWHP